MDSFSAWLNSPRTFPHRYNIKRELSNNLKGEIEAQETETSEQLWVLSFLLFSFSFPCFSTPPLLLFPFLSISFSYSFLFNSRNFTLINYIFGEANKALTRCSRATATLSAYFDNITSRNYFNLKVPISFFTYSQITLLLSYCNRNINNLKRNKERKKER